MVADGGLALCAKIGTQLGDVPLFLGEQHEHLQASGIGDLLEQFGDATDLGEGATPWTTWPIGPMWSRRDGMVFLNQYYPEGFAQRPNPDASRNPVVVDGYSS